MTHLSHSVFSSLILGTPSLPCITLLSLVGAFATESFKIFFRCSCPSKKTHLSILKNIQFICLRCRNVQKWWMIHYTQHFGATKMSYQLWDAFRQASFMATAVQIHSTSNYNNYFVKKNGWMRDYKLQLYYSPTVPYKHAGVCQSVKPKSLVACVIQSWDP